MLLPVRSRIAKIRDLLRYSLWFVPILTIILGVLAGILLTSRAGRSAGAETAPAGALAELLAPVLPDNPDTLRQVLRLIAGSMITVATTAFSITIVALQLASSQLGPRLLRNFVRDRTNQFVFGVLLATFSYALVVLQRIPEGDAVLALAPAYAAALLLTALSVLFFVVFIHHTATSVQTDAVIAGVGRELDFSLGRLFPMTIGEAPPRFRRGEDGAEVQRFPGARRIDWATAQPVGTRNSGYIQALDGRFLLAFAERHDLVVRLERRPGDFVERGSTVALVWPGDRIPPRRGRRIREVFIIGNQRTQQQDVAFVFHQLVEIALRALSPGINDSFTAIRCIDRLTDALIYVGENAFPSPYRYGSDGELRVIAQPLSFSVVLSLVFNPIAESAVDRSAVVLHLFDAVAKIARRAYSDESRKALDSLADYLLYLSQTSSAYAATEERILAAYSRVSAVLRNPPGETP